MPKWRTNTITNLWQPDWPMLADLTYTNAELMTGALREYPMGDLNWFPSKKASWANTNEAENLWAALKAGTIPTGIRYETQQRAQFSVYPNPATSNMNIHFELTEGAGVELKVFNLMGEQVSSMDLGYLTRGQHSVSLDNDNLSSGLYIMQMVVGNMASGSTKIVIE